MNIISTILIIFVALEFFYIMYLETIATTSRKTSETFNISVDKLKDKNINVLLKNQGVYNGLIGVLLIYGLFISSNPKEICAAILVYIIGVAIYGGLSSNISIFFKTRHIASIGTYINALVSIGVLGFGDVVGGLEDLSDLGMDFRLRVFQPNYFKQR
ncbi:membrane protein [Staphylococcus aureus]|uniref:Membrane protein n=1 Tax=Staphylococcus aureus TaxID=1280 RepID=A0A2X2JSZ5_STAAU|nr:membrane protein [Staphylococcus aureus]